MPPRRAVILPDSTLKFTFSMAATWPKYLASELTSTAKLGIHTPLNSGLYKNEEHEVHLGYT
jgi:hypothetical protein